MDDPAAREALLAVLRQLLSESSDEPKTSAVAHSADLAQTIEV